jgi:microtubule-associated protein tau
LSVAELPVSKVRIPVPPPLNPKTVPSKVASLSNIHHKPGGGKVKIENRKIDYSKVKAKINTNRRAVKKI